MMAYIALSKPRTAHMIEIAAAQLGLPTIDVVNPMLWNSPRAPVRGFT
jgi:hypothetical protein